MDRLQFKYFAFISYNSKDTEWGKRVQKKLEHYRMPATLCNEHGWERTPIKPVFFAPTDIQPGGLTEELQERLRASRNLIVICSPNSAQSEWVGKEIEFFHQLGRTKQIHFFIVDGIPHSGNPDTECFNPIVNTLGLPEILGANIHEHIFRWPWLNKERAYVQLISKLLGVEFDAIWQRHKRLLVQKTIAWSIGIIAIICFWVATIKSFLPFSSEILIEETPPANSNLPSYNGGVVALYLGNEVLTDTICPEKGKSTFSRIPKQFHNNLVRVVFEHKDYLKVDTMLPLVEFTRLKIQRNPDIYGHIRVRLWNALTENYVTNCKVTITNRGQGNYNSDEFFSSTVVSNSSGLVEVHIPIEYQQPAYSVEADTPLDSHVIYMPCGEDDVILVKH